MVVVSGTNSYAKEMAIRKRISNIFNKREDDFPSLRDYNDYLEEVEDMTFNLIEGIEVAAIDAKISKYQEENAEQIINARAQKAEDLASALAASKGVPMQHDAIDGGAIQSSEVGESVGGQMQYAPAVTGIAYGQPRPVPVGGGPDMRAFTADDEEMAKLRAERGAKAGGWSCELSKRRSIEEAFDSVWI